MTTNPVPTPVPASAPAALAGSLRRVARGLETIADSVRRDADAAIFAVRALEATAGETASLATALATAAEQIGQAITLHAALLDETATGADTSLSVVAGLRDAASGIVAMSSTIGEIAGRSRLLALNARIEASRAGPEGAGFAVVAHEMGLLAKSTLTATRDIEGSTDRILGDVEATRSAFEGVRIFVGRERTLVDEIVGASDQQKVIAADVARLTEATRDRIDDSAMTIGRLSSSASAVGLMARQIVRGRRRRD